MVCQAKYQDIAMKEDVVHYKKYSTNELHNLEGVAGSRL